MFLRLVPEYASACILFPEPVSNLSTEISQPSSEMEASLATALRDFVAQLDHHKFLIQNTFLRYNTYQDTTEEKRISKEIFDQHVRHFNEAFRKFGKYLFDTRGLRCHKDDSVCSESVFSCLLADLERQEDCSGITLAYMDICLEILDFKGSEAEGQQMSVSRVVELVHSAHAISKDLAIRHWNGASPVHLTEEEAKRIKDLHDKWRMDFASFKGI